MRIISAFVLFLTLCLPSIGFSQEADAASTSRASEAASESRGGFFSGIGEVLGRVAAAPVKAVRDLADGAQRGWSSDRPAASLQPASPRSVSTALASVMASAKSEQSTLSAAAPAQGAAQADQGEPGRTRAAGDKASFTRARAGDQASVASSGRKARTTGASGATALGGVQGVSASTELVNGYREKAALSQVPLDAAARATLQTPAPAPAKASALDRTMASMRDAVIGKQAPAVIEDRSIRASSL